MKLNELTIHELQKKLQDREIASVDLVEATFAQIDKVENKIHAYITLTKEKALIQAAEADRQIKAGTAGSLCGIPIALKDTLCTEGIRTTCASRMLHNFVPPYDATVVQLLKQAGAVFTGKTNTDEFAMGSSTETSYFGTTRNPWDLERVPGGSSGGSAAAVITGECIASLGTDTGGSVRQPASLCGIVGIKPTYGRVSRFGAISFGPSLDQVGPFTKDVEDGAIMLNVIAGYDAKDSVSSPLEVPDYRSFLNKDIKGWTVGIPQEYFTGGLDADVAEALKLVIQVLKNQGVQIKEISLPHTKYCIAVFCIVGTAEASSNLARYDGMEYGYRIEKAANLMDLYKQCRNKGFGAEVKRRIMLGTYALSAGYYDAYYKKASQVRTLIKEDFDEAFKTCDVVLAPTSPTPAFKIGEKNDDPLKMYLSDVFTVSANLAGIPAISVPCGFSHHGLPIGVQFLARHFEEGKLFQIAHNYEQYAQLEKRRPDL